MVDSVFVLSGQAVLLAPVVWYWWARETPRTPAEVALLPVLASVTLLPLALLLGVLYHVYFWSVKGATPGKELLELRVVTDDGRSPIPLASALRPRARLPALGGQPGAGLPDGDLRRARASRPHRLDPGRQGPGGDARRPRARAGGARRRAGARAGPDAGPRGVASGARQRFLRAGWEFLHDLSVAVLFCFFLIAFVAQAFRVQGTSMEPLLLDGERIVVNKFVYRLRTIQRGDVVVFWYPRDPSVSFVKRVVGLPGDLVEMRGGELLVNGRVVKEAYLPASFRDDDNHPPTEVRKGYYFVLGDHRRSSNDSRNWGEVPEKYIYGRAVFRFWPLGRMGPIR